MMCGREMKVQDLLNYVFDNVSIYREIDLFKFETLYQGNYRDVPSYLLSMEIRTVGAKRNMVDIQILS